MPTWSVVWLAPVPRSAAGRSAERTSSRSPAWDASRTAGWRLTTAVPDVVTTATGRWLPLARPSARKPAVRSSTRTWSLRRPSASAWWRTTASAADRDPGDSTTSVTPLRHSAATTATDIDVAAFTGRADPARRCRRSAVGASGLLWPGQRGRRPTARGRARPGVRRSGPRRGSCPGSPGPG